MSAPFQAAAPAMDEGNTVDIPKRAMRVKVLYTFDDQNKSNCLARIPNALNVPVVSLDENTQVGVIELKTCIQTIVAASPELVAQLGHDYTVYAYDYSEYETPLVGQGMLSWILASASPTPNAPADESQTMVTGRVCKNILGIFSNGVKETLEVKLKLVPVPTCMQKEYVENMERYHSLSQLMPQGFDYSVWSDFLKENPTLGQLVQPNPARPSPPSPFGGMEPFHHMLSRRRPAQEVPRDDAYHISNMPNNAHTTRASSPAMSTISFQHYQPHSDSRPASRASFRCETAAPSQQPLFSDSYTMEQQEEGPPKKRARIMQAKRPKKTPLTMQSDSLRVTASAAASVRLHRPVPSRSSALADLVPRAPTPQPENSFGRNEHRRPPAPSALRQSMDHGQSYTSPYDTSAFSDHVVDSADEMEASPGETPLDIPSSPPVVLQDHASSVPSSPALPILSLPTDSGFVSDTPIGRDHDATGIGNKAGYGSDSLLFFDDRVRPRRSRSQRPWQHVNPGPVDRLPQSYVPRPKQHYRKLAVPPIAGSVEQNTKHPSRINHHAPNDNLFDSSVIQHAPKIDEAVVVRDVTPQTDSVHHALGKDIPSVYFALETTAQPTGSEAPQCDISKSISAAKINCQVNPSEKCENPITNPSAASNSLPGPPRSSKPRGLPRSNTWSGPGEAASDAPIPTEANNPRSGSGAKRKKYIKERLEKAIAAGEMPQHCVNCGEIDTPAWRKAYTRVEIGNPDDLELSNDTAGTEIFACEVIESLEETDREQKYRIFKNNLTREEKDTNAYESLNLCNSCGLWLIKKASMRPQKQWDKTARMNKRKRDQVAEACSKTVRHGGDPVFDANMPGSEPVMPSGQEERTKDDTVGPPPIRGRAGSLQAAIDRPDSDMGAAQAAFRRAVQSSPAYLKGSKSSPIDVEPDLTPKPTRRLLFPSSQKDSEVESTIVQPLGVVSTNESSNVPHNLVSDRPRCQRCKTLKKGCDRERPCGRCDNAGIGYEGCIPCEPPRTNWFERPMVRMATVEEEGPDKENRPPSPILEQDRLGHHFEDSASAKVTPEKDSSNQELLKTPTPGSRHRVPLTSKCGSDSAAGLLMTPSRITLTPRGNHDMLTAPETPFTRQLNSLLSDCQMPTPSQNIDLSAFTSFRSPGRGGTYFSDFLPDDFLSSDMFIPSSPSKGSLGQGFDLYEDPNTSTVGLWDDGNIFGNGPTMLDVEDGADNTSANLDEGSDAATLLKMNVGGIMVDFAAMIEEVVSTVGEDAESQAKIQSPKVQNLGLVKTPEPIEPVGR